MFRVFHMLHCKVVFWSRNCEKSEKKIWRIGSCLRRRGWRLRPIIGTIGLIRRQGRARKPIIFWPERKIDFLMIILCNGNMFCVIKKLTKDLWRECKAAACHHPGLNLVVRGLRQGSWCSGRGAGEALALEQLPSTPVNRPSACTYILLLLPTYLHTVLLILLPTSSCCPPLVLNAHLPHSQLHSMHWSRHCHNLSIFQKSQITMRWVWSLLGSYFPCNVNSWTAYI